MDNAKHERILAAKVDRLLSDIDDLEQDLENLSEELREKGIRQAMEKMAMVIPDRELSAGFPVCKKTLAWLFTEMGRKTLESEL